MAASRVAVEPGVFLRTRWAGVRAESSFAARLRARRAASSCIFSSAFSRGVRFGSLKIGPDATSAASFGSSRNGVPSMNPQVMVGSKSTPGCGDGVTTNPYPLTRGESADPSDVGGAIVEPVAPPVERFVSMKGETAKRVLAWATD